MVRVLFPKEGKPKGEALAPWGTWHREKTAQAWPSFVFRHFGLSDRRRSFWGTFVTGGRVYLRSNKKAHGFPCACAYIGMKSCGFSTFRYCFIRTSL
jgi:hypothetical protein